MNEQLLETLLLYHEKKNRELIRNQVKEISTLIANNRSRYDSSNDYRDGIDDALKLVLQGKFV